MNNKNILPRIQRFFSIFFVFTLLISSISVFFSSNSYASSNYTGFDAFKTSESFQYFMVTSQCFKWGVDSDKTTVKKSEAKDITKWFTESDTDQKRVIVTPSPEDGATEMTCAEAMKTALVVWGFVDSISNWSDSLGEDFLTNIGYTKKSTSSGSYTYEGSSNQTDRVANYMKYILDNVYGGSSGILDNGSAKNTYTNLWKTRMTDAGKYWLYYSAFKSSCYPSIKNDDPIYNPTSGIVSNGKDSTNARSHYYEPYINSSGNTGKLTAVYDYLDLVDTTTNTKKASPVLYGDMVKATNMPADVFFGVDDQKSYFDDSAGISIDAYGTNNDLVNGGEVTHRDFYDLIDDGNIDYYFYEKPINIFGRLTADTQYQYVEESYGYNQIGTDTGYYIPTVKSCSFLAKKLSSDYLVGTSNKATLATWFMLSVATQIQDGTSIDQLSATNIATPNVETETETSCNLEGIGWIVCPIMTFLSNAADQAFGFLADNFLQTETNLVDQDSGTYKAWQSVRDIANVVFVIIFMIIILSQLTSFGIDNYGIKKLLPKLIIGAILVNMSFFICQIAVDLSNILGFSIKDFLEGVSSGIQTGNPIIDTNNGGKLAATMTILLTGTITVVLVMSIPLVVAVLVALLITLFILLARKALIVLLIVIAPLAFVAYLLPNTNQYFKKWYQMFAKILLVFPVISLLYGAGILASTIINEAGSDDENMLQLVAIAVAVLPLLLTPALLKKSIDAIGSMGSKVSGIGDRWSKSIGDKGTKIYDRTALARGKVDRNAAKDMRRDQIYADAVSGKNTTGADRLRRLAARGIHIRKNAKFADNRLAGMALQRSDKADDSNVANEELLMRSRYSQDKLSSEAEKEMYDAINKGDTYRAIAAQKILAGSGAPGIASIRSVINRIETDEKNDDGSVRKGRIMGTTETDVAFFKSLNSLNLKAKDNTLAAKSYKSSLSLSEIAGQINDTYAGLNPVELAGQPEKDIERIASSLKIEQIQDVLSNQAALSVLSPKKKELLKTALNNRVNFSDGDGI